MAAALLDDFFEHSHWLLPSALLWTFLGYLRGIFNRPKNIIATRDKKRREPPQ